MAHYFLADSPTYCSRTRPDIFKRREVICMFLTDEYRSVYGRADINFQKISSELAKYSISISRAQYHSDKTVIYSAFRYLLAANVEEREQIIEQLRPHSKPVIACLIEDGITSLSQCHPKYDAQASKKSHQEVSDEASRDINTLDHDNGEGELGIDPQMKSTEIELLQKQVADNEDISLLFQAELDSISAQLEEARHQLKAAYSFSIEELITVYPDIKELYVALIKIQEKPSKFEESEKKLKAQLPFQFTWKNDSGKVKYSRNFLIELNELKIDEQTHVIEQIQFLATQGSEYASLHTRKLIIRLPHSPQNCMQSRATKTLRFTWKKEKDGALTLYWLYRKGKGQVRMRE